MMKIYPVLACAAFAATAAFCQDTPPPPVPPSAPAPFNKPSGVVVPQSALSTANASKVIVSYWDVVRDMMMRAKNAPPRPARSAGRPGELRPDYPFEEFRNLRGSDLVRAAHEGAIAARRQKADRPAAEVDRQVWENAMMALEYFPLVVRDDTDIRTIARVIENRDEDLQLRRFVLDKLAPAQKDPSLLSMFLDDAYARYSGNFGKALDTASSHPLENPSFQIESMRVNYDRLMKRYNDAFAADAKIAALVKETGQPVAATALLGENPPELEKATKDKLAGIGLLTANFAGLIAVHIDPNSAADPAVKAEVRRLLEKIAAEVLVPDRELLLHWLDPSRPVPAAPAGEGMPAMPALPDTGNDELLMPALPGADSGLPVEPQVSQGNQPPPTPVPLPSGL